MAKFGQLLKNDKTLRRVAIVLIVSSFIIAFLSTLGEFIFYRYSIAGYGKPAEMARLSAQKAEKLNPPVPPLKILPTDIAGFDTTFRQLVPGERYAAEAIYRSSSEELSPTAPIDTYVRITYYGSAKEALDNIKRALKDRYHRDSRATTVSRQPAYAGYDEDYGSYYLAWNWRNYSIEITTSYTQNIPKERGTLQSNLSLKVAQSLMNVLQASVR